MTEVLFSSENQQYAVEYGRVVSVVIYVIPNEAEVRAISGLPPHLPLEIIVNN